MTPYADHTDPALFERIATGDTAAFGAIYFRYVEKLLPHITKILRDEYVAEEVLQEVFIKLWDVRVTLADVQYPNAFLYRMAANRTLDHMRHLETLRKVNLGAQAALSIDARNTTEEQFDAAERERILRQALERLPPQQQLIYTLQREQGLTQDQIAEQLNLSKNTVRNHMAEALKNIRAHFLQHGLTVLLYLIQK